MSGDSKISAKSAGPQAIIPAITKRLPWVGSATSIHMQEVIEGASVAFVLKIVGTALAFAFNVLLARMLGAERVGIYFLALTVVTIGALVGRIGLDNALLRFTASSAVREQWDRIAGLYRIGIRLSTIASVIITLAVFMTAPWISNVVFSEPQLSFPLRLMSIGILPFGMLTLHSSLLKGLKKIRDATIVRALAIPLLSIPLLLILGPWLGVEGATIAYVVANTLVWLLSVRMWRTAAPYANDMRGSFNTGLLVATSLPLFWIDTVNYAMSSAGTVMLGIWLDSEIVGIFGVAFRTTLLMRFVLDSTNSIVAPKIAALYEQRAIGSLNALMRNVAILMAVVAAPVMLMFLVAPHWILALFGSEFSGGATALMILAAGQYVNVATGSVGYLLLMTGYEKPVRNNVILSAILNVLLNVLLIPKFGLVGAAVASASSIAVKNLITVFLVRKYLSMKLWSPHIG